VKLTRRRTALAASVLAAAALAGACGPRGSAVVVDLGNTPRTYVPADYRPVLARWTRRALITKDFDTTLDVAATFKSHDFRWAYAVRYSAQFQLSTADQDKLLKGQLAELDAAHEFLVSAAATRFEWIDFHKKDSVWRVTLLDDGGHQVAPLEIRKLRTPTAELEAFFPPSTRSQPMASFYTTYLLRFPRKLPDGTPLDLGRAGKVTLRFAGVLGSAELNWVIKQPAPK
jgi:hypothetical protein